MAWFQSAFGKSYLSIYAHRSEAEALQDLKNFLPHLLPLSPDALILDLCCGTGRHLSAFRSLGFTSILGLDLSLDLLEEAQKKNPETLLLQGDMRKLPFAPHGFDAIFQLFTSFGYFSEEENLAFLAQIPPLLRHRPQGFYVLDYLNPPYLTQQLVPRSSTFTPEFTLIQERRIHKNRIEKEVYFKPTEGKPLQYRESVRLYTLEEMTELCREVGFQHLRFFGDFQGKPYDSSSPRMILMAY